MTNSYSGRIALLCFAVSILLFSGVARGEKFVIAWSAVSALNSPFWVMNDGGFLKQEGLDMELVYIASSPTVARRWRGRSLFPVPTAR
jgi:ABC-type nitrate/sulfonate/bicarbonate transport system substrate-binding protein